MTKIVVETYSIAVLVKQINCTVKKCCVDGYNINNLITSLVRRICLTMREEHSF
jgi:hypothetical protein